MKLSVHFLFFGLLLSLSTPTIASCEGIHKIFTMMDPIDQKPFEIKAKFYKPKSGLKVSAVFILPPITGENPIDRRMAKKICKNGMASLVVNVVKTLTIEEEIVYFGTHDDTYVRALAAIKTVIHELKNDSDLSGKFGILGMSLGGMISTYIAGSEPDILASVIVVGAGNVPGILAYSDQKHIKAIRKERMKRFNIPTQKAYEAFFQNLIPHDPITVAANVRPGSMFLIMASTDKTVPTKYQKQLRDVVPNPKVHVMKAHHVSGVIAAGTIHASKITNFFLSQL